jgi:murein DD-endopeptidase MepM/ murein hydrolase activator NlpD
MVRTLLLSFKKNHNILIDGINLLKFYHCFQKKKQTTRSKMEKLALLIIISGSFYFFSSSKSTNAQNFKNHQPSSQPISAVPTEKDVNNTPLAYFDSLFNENKNFETDGFDFPVGKPDASNYFNAQAFGENAHLGEDWNGNGGGNTDLGDPVYSTANGLVTFTEDVCCGWGNIVRIVHKIPNHPDYNYVESFYAHLHNINVKNGQFVKRGQQIGTIGTANGRYRAHLHFEMRDKIDMPIGQGYSEDKTGYFSPTPFINKNRPLKN